VLDVVIQGTACFVQEIDVTKFLPLVSDMEPANPATHMGMFHQQVRHIAHAASGPVSQSEDGFAAQIVLLLKEIAQDEPLVWRQDAGSQRLLRFDLHPTGGDACQSLLLLNEPLAKPVDHCFDAGAKTDTVPLFFEEGQIKFYNRHGELGGHKVPGMSMP
jgi:hypothetical protein